VLFGSLDSRERLVADMTIPDFVLISESPTKEHPEYQIATFF
jgi:hypothetical protein